MTSVGVWNPSHWPNSAQLQTHRGSALEPKRQGTEVTHLSCSLTQLPPKPPQGKSIACQPSPFLPSQTPFLWEAALPPFTRGGAGPEGGTCWVLELEVCTTRGGSGRPDDKRAVCRGNPGIRCSALLSTSIASSLLQKTHPLRVVQRWLPFPAIKAP